MLGATRTSGWTHALTRLDTPRHDRWQLLTTAAARQQQAAPASSRPGQQQQQQQQQHPVVVVGAGAAGLTAAYFAAKAGAKVLVLERTREAGKKVLMSGGTRCNVLPQEVDTARDYFTSSSRSALRAVFSTWSLEQCLAWLADDVGLDLQLEEATAKWFPASNSSREVRDRLVERCRSAGVTFEYEASVEGIRRLEHQALSRTETRHPPGTTPASTAAAAAAGADSGGVSSSGGGAPLWQVELRGGGSVVGQRLVLATGGLSFPAVGTDGTGHRLLQRAGHTLVTPYPALTPLTGRHPGGHQLAGLTLPEVVLEAWPPGATPGGRRRPLATSQRGGFLFTHRGFSGPSVLDLSHWAVQAMAVPPPAAAAAAAAAAPAASGVPRLTVNWTGRSRDAWEQLLQPGQGGGAAARGASRVSAALHQGGLPERLACALADSLGLGGVVLGQLRKGDREALVAAATAWPLPLTGHEGYKKAEVTGGGVPLEQVDCRTLESRVLPGVFLCGELLDVFGRIGGFNFFWAWVSGRAAGLGVAAAAAAHTSAGAGHPPQRSRARSSPRT